MRTDAVEMWRACILVVLIQALFLESGQRLYPWPSLHCCLNTDHNILFGNAGVHASDDGADVACPVSLIDWFLSFYKATQKGPVQPLEGICRAGEVLFVPRGWWHMALNLEVWHTILCWCRVLCSCQQQLGSDYVLRPGYFSGSHKVVPADNACQNSVAQIT